MEELESVTTTSRTQSGQPESQPRDQLPHYWGTTPEQEYYNLQGIKSSKSFYASPRGLKLFTRQWLPLRRPRGIIFMVHGYGNDISWTFQATPIFLAQNGFACFALDLEGHGGSDGLRAFVPDVGLVVNDCLSFINLVKHQDPQFQGLPCFLYGESMGGAICLLIHFAAPEAFQGAILAAPMCKISDKVKPRWPIPEILTFVAKYLPRLAIVPTADLMRKSVKVEEKKIVADMNPSRYRGKPRLGTVVELLRVTQYVSERLGDVSLPFIVLHGSADVVTDPEVSMALYAAAKSEDKTLKIYEGMMHSLLFGETDENVEVVRGDILGWLNHRCGGGGGGGGERDE
ncbi:caffeoylshikimate esterase-like [Pyrus ussuriensis x Pyrus communis]|uniref:Caffeoylshikimate esterase-like n=1 Tax=Pyrus ussuriensis x Pyrus communis TaxID=2448454 RepID=A0A5N5FDI1_9ROSA|nr:caffeoylshikimate esterase-like [Pyrus ussuriensis x Pyrus communis]